MECGNLPKPRYVSLGESPFDEGSLEAGVPPGPLSVSDRIRFVLFSYYILNGYSESARIFDTRFSHMFRETF